MEATARLVPAEDVASGPATNLECHRDSRGSDRDWPEPLSDDLEFHSDRLGWS